MRRTYVQRQNPHQSTPSIRFSSSHRGHEIRQCNQRTNAREMILFLKRHVTVELCECSNQPVGLAMCSWRMRRGQHRPSLESNTGLAIQFGCVRVARPKQTRVANVLQNRPSTCAAHCATDAYPYSKQKAVLLPSPGQVVII